MLILKTIAWLLVIAYVATIALLYFLQTRLIFYPGRLQKNYSFSLGSNGRELFFRTADGETINALFYRGSSPDVILYFHGNAGDLSGWQYIAEDFTDNAFNILLIDYRGYGKSTGSITEQGLYLDALAAYEYLLTAGFTPDRILIWGRSIGSGVAVHLAGVRACKGLIVESGFSSMSRLANEKLPLLFPSLYLKFRFDNAAKIKDVKCPVLFLHGSHDTLIPPEHSRMLHDRITGTKRRIVIDRGEHNDLHTFSSYQQFLKSDLQSFFAE